MTDELTADQLVEEVTGLTRTTRTARQGFWFPLLLLGFIVLASTPLYLGRSTDGVPGVTERSISFPILSIGGNITSPRAVGLYWLISLPLAYLCCGFWYWRRARRRGVGTSPVAFAVTGIVLLALLVLVSPGLDSGRYLLQHARGVPILGILGALRGTGALLTIALGLFVLSYQERSRALALFSLVFFGAALLANYYNLENVLYRVGINPGATLSPAVGVLFAGLVLTLGGAGFAIARRRTS